MALVREITPESTSKQHEKVWRKYEKQHYIRWLEFIIDDSSMICEMIYENVGIDIIHSIYIMCINENARFMDREWKSKNTIML